MRALIVAVTILFLINAAYAAFGPPPQATATPTPAATPAATATPALTPAAVALKCSELLAAKDRVRCRINLASENELNYLPEECRARADKDACLSTYKTIRPCFRLENDVARVACANKGLALGNIAEAKKACADDACLNSLRSKIFDLVKFRMYNLEYKAQELKEKGVSEDLAVDFISSVEQKKIEFNSASLEQKKAIVKEVIVLWQDFVARAKQQVKP